MNVNVDIHIHSNCHDGVDNMGVVFITFRTTSLLLAIIPVWGFSVVRLTAISANVMTQRRDAGVLNLLRHVLVV